MTKAQDLYFILNPSLGTIKIGIAESVAERRYALECACGVALDVLGVLSGGAEFERPLHAAFHDHRLVGEWFAPSEALCALADDPSTVPAYVTQHAAVIKANASRAMAASQERRREGVERRRAEREARRVLEIAAAHADAVRENRRRDRKAAAAAAAEEQRLAAERKDQVAALSRSPRIVDRLIAKEMSAAAEARVADVARFSSQRLRNAAFAGVRRAGAV